MKHYVLTRWNNIDTKRDVYTLVKDPERWMRERVVLFEKYCLPAMMSQTDKDFIWVLGFSKDTPKKIYEKYQKLPNIRVVFDYPRDHIEGLYGTEIKKNDWIITSRLDNDDSVSPHYIRQLHEQLTYKEEVIDFSGYQYDTQTDKWYHSPYHDPVSPFLSLVENVKDSVVTAMRFQHDRIATHYPGRFIDEPIYCQVIHGDNLACRIRGVPTNQKHDNEFWNYSTTSNDPR